MRHAGQPVSMTRFSDSVKVGNRLSLYLWRRANNR